MKRVAGQKLCVHAFVGQLPLMLSVRPPKSVLTSTSSFTERCVGCQLLIEKSTEVMLSILRSSVIVVAGGSLFWLLQLQ